MLKEVTLIAAALRSRQACETIEKFGRSEDFGPIASSVLGVCVEYYRDDASAGTCNLDIIRSRIVRGLPNPAHARAFDDFLSSLPEDVSTVAVDSELREFHRQQVGGKLALALANGSKLDDVEKLIGLYQSAGTVASKGDERSEVVDVAAKALQPKDKDTDSLIKLWPKSLNDAVAGRIKRGHHILVFAYTNVGKTTFTVNMVAGFVAQGLRVLYVGNEEGSVWERIIGRLCRVPVTALDSITPELADKIKEFENKVSFSTLATFSALRSLLEQHDNYDVVVLDQIRNFRQKSDGRTAELEAAGIEARAIARDFSALVVSVTQGGAATEHKIHLDISDIDSSKVGIPGSTDVIIGLGADKIMKANGMLGVSVCKSKFGPSSNFTATVNFSTGVIS